MPYGLKYVTQFDSDPDDFNPSVRYTLQFLFKDYAGPVISIEGGSTTVLQKCTIDDPLAPIKGQSLDMLLINSGTLPITNFYADNDNDIQVILLNELLQPLFIGFLIQDDCHEIMVDDAHEIQLSANDSLGLLKDIPLNTNIANISFVQGHSAALISSTSPHEIVLSVCFFMPIIGVPFIITSHPTLNGTYTITQIDILGSNFYRVHVAETVGSHTGLPGIAESVGVVNLNSNVSLLTLINICLYNTGLQIITNIFCNVKEQRQVDAKSHFEQTFVNAGMFINNDVYEDCYSVLTKILGTSDCQLQQTNGQWNIIHWFEVRLYANNAIPGYVYDEQMRLVGTTALNNNFFIGPDVNNPQPTVPTFSLMQSILRPYKFVRRQFNYVTPKYLLANFDLQLLGALIRTYVDGTNTISEYVPIGFYDGDLAPHGELFIRVVFDNILQTESIRYLVTKPPQGNFPRAVVGAPDIIIHKGDTIKFSATFRTNVTSSLPFDVLMSFKITDGTTSYFITNIAIPGRVVYNPTLGYVVTVDANTPATNWNSFDFTTEPFPFDGVLQIHYALASINVTGTFWKDMRLEYTAYVNDSTKIIGHVHKQNRINDIKNNSDEEIFMDDSPRNAVTGTLLLDHITGLIPDRTLNWQYNSLPGIYYKRGQLFTHEEIIYRDKMRSKFEGGFIGLHQSNIISMLAVIVTDFYPTKKYIFGLLTIDYKRNQFNGTLWEIWDTVEPDVIADYTFKYLYSTT